MTDNNYVEIELWKYDPIVYTVDGMVDIISLNYVELIQVYPTFFEWLRIIMPLPVMSLTRNKK